MTAYAELDVRSNFSFLEGASHPAELVFQAKVLGLAAIGVADRNSLAGVVRAHAEAKAKDMRLLVGCRLQFTDGAELIVYPRDRAAYGRLCRIRAYVTSGLTESREIRSNLEWRLSPRVSVEGSYDNVNDISSSTLGNLGADVRWRLEFE